MATVEIENISKSYGRVEVIHGIDLAIAEGEFVSLIGASGCGKSTLLRMIAGLETITSGTISLDGRRVNDVAPKNRDIAMVFQNYALYPHLTVFENMGFSLRLRGVPKSEIETAVSRAAGFLGLEDYLERHPRELSGGQRQRVAMGRAIVREPQVFLFDEPLSNLDAKLRVQMRVEIKALQKRLGTTSIYVTHDQMEAMTMSDRIVVLNAGRIEQFGAPLDVYDRPANIFVAGFIGSPGMNMFDGRIERDGDTVLVRIGDRAVAIGDVPVAHGTEVVLGIRPEHLSLDGRDTGGVRLPFAVDLVEPTGAELHVYGRVLGTPVTATSHGRPTIHGGETIEISAATESLHLFDKATGRRLD